MNKQDAMWVYTERVKEHFMNPRNILEDDESFEEDGKGMVGSMACGDQMLIVIKVEEEKIKECKWKTYGCASAIASTSKLSEFAIGKTLEEAYNITPSDITRELGGLPNHKFHCSVLGDKALRAAIDDYLGRNNLPNPYKDSVAKTICECKNITDQQIEEQVKSGVRSYDKLQEVTGIGTVCGKCKDKTMELLEEFKHLYE